MKSLKERTEIQQAFLDGTDIVKRYLGCKADTLWNDCVDIEAFDWGNYDFKIKPKPMEIWVNIYADGDIFGHRNKDSAKSALISDSGNVRLAVKFIEVIE